MPISSSSSLASPSASAISPSSARAKAMLRRKPATANVINKTSSSGGGGGGGSTTSSSKKSRTSATTGTSIAELNQKIEARKASTGTTSTMTAASSSGSLSLTVEESLERMRTNLSRFARVSNKRMAIRSLQECNYLRAIPMDTVPTAPTQKDEWELLKEEVCWSNICLNGLLFHGSANSQVLKVLRALCMELCKGLRLSSESIYLAVLVRLATTTNSADSYFQLNALLGSQDLVLQPKAAAIGGGSDDPASGSDSSSSGLPPTDVSVYESAGEIHATVTAYTSYGLFRRSDVKTGKPWISIIAQVRERVNLSTGMSVRQVQAQVVNANLMEGRKE